MSPARMLARLPVRSQDDADRLRRLSFLLFLVLFVPVAAFLGWRQATRGQVVEPTVVLSMAALFVVIGVAVTRVREARPLYRLAIGVGVLVLAYEIAIGASSGHGFLWFYLFPTVTMVLVGEREGLVWSLAAVAAGLPFLLTDLGAEYPAGVVLRFFVTFAVVALCCHQLESSRRRYEDRLNAERVSLREALDRVRTLRGLLPLCPSCKKVRHDEGYWEQVEDTFARQVNIRFSHGLCPGCVEATLAEIEEV